MGEGLGESSNGRSQTWRGNLNTGMGSGEMAGQEHGTVGNTAAQYLFIVYMWWPLKEPLFLHVLPVYGIRLTSESVQSASLTLQSVHNVHGSHGLPLGVLCVCDGVTDHVLEEHLQHSTSLLVDQARDSLHTTTASETTDGWLGDTLDVITQHLPVTLGATLSESFASFTTSRHDSLLQSNRRMNRVETWRLLLWQKCACALAPFSGGDILSGTLCGPICRPQETLTVAIFKLDESSTVER